MPKLSPGLEIFRPLSAFAAVAGIMASGPVHAQSIDYSALQQLFGEPVTTSVIGTPQRARDVPAAMEIVTADDIRRSGAIDIPGVLRHVMGVDVSRWSVLGADVGVRGYNSPMNPRLLVLIDGRQVYMDDFGRTEWASLPVELAEIRQIEIVKGPNSALFGFNAAGGVINIITFNPLYDRINTAAVTVGTQGTREASAVASDKVTDTLGIRLSAGGTVSNDFRSIRNLAGQAGLHQDTSRNQISADMHWKIDAASELELQASHGENQRLGNTPPWIPAYLHNEVNSVLARYIRETSAGVITATGYSDWSYATAAFDPRLGTTGVKFQTQLTVATLQDEFELATDHAIRVSAEFRHHSANTSPANGGTIAYDIASVGGMWHWSITPELSLTTAARADILSLSRGGAGLEQSRLTNDDWSRQIVEPSYNLGLVWHPVEADRYRVTVAHGAQLPSLLGLGAIQNLGLAFFQVSGDPAMQPTIINNYEFDWDHDISALHAQSRVAVFYQTTHAFQGMISPLKVNVLASGAFESLVNNVGDSEEVGAEFGLKGNFWESWRWGMSYSPRLVRDHFFDGASLASTGQEFAHTTPRHVVDGSLGWANNGWEVDGFVRLQSSASGIFLSPQSGFGVARLGPTVAFDGRVAYRIDQNVTAALAAQNVLFSSARQTSFGKSEQQVFGSLSVHF